MRVVSPVPSLTETMLHLGVVPIACTRFCERPELTHVGGTKDPDIAAIVRMSPDLVLMDREENRLDDAQALEALGIAVHATHVTSVHDVAPMLRSLAERIGGDLTQIDVDGSDTDRTVGTRWSAFVPIWRRPWMTISATTYGSSLLDSIGISNVFADADTAYPTVTLADAAARNPQLVLLPSEPYPFKERHIAELADAMPAAAIHLVDGQDLFWWGARTAQARRRLAQAPSGSDA